MAEGFVEVDRKTPTLLPADLREWVPEEDLVHFGARRLIASTGHVVQLWHQPRSQSITLRSRVFRSLSKKRAVLIHHSRKPPINPPSNPTGS
jgi:hypothetical protein